MFFCLEAIAYTHYRLMIVDNFTWQEAYLDNILYCISNYSICYPVIIIIMQCWSKLAFGMHIERGVHNNYWVRISMFKFSKRLSFSIEKVSISLLDGTAAGESTTPSHNHCDTIALRSDHMQLGQVMYRLHHEVQVSTRFTHRGPETRGCVNRVETEPSDVNDLYHGTQRRVLLTYKRSISDLLTSYTAI